MIKPSWEDVSPDEKRMILEIDPASSFGTGQHHTTQLCLELLEKYITDGDRVLDLGCGSGILSIGAILLGAEECTAVDIDANSVKIAAGVPVDYVPTRIILQNDIVITNDDVPDTMFVLTNDTKVNGAAAVLNDNIRQEIADKLNKKSMTYVIGFFNR